MTPAASLFLATQQPLPGTNVATRGAQSPRVAEQAPRPQAGEPAPTGGNELIEKNEDNGLSLVQLDPPNPWDTDPKIPLDLDVGELQVDEHLRFMILMDGVHPEMDTCIIVEYKGHKILNTVDCTQPNGGKLPTDVAVMMSDFAGGASGFPMTFSGGKFTEKWKAQFIKTERKKLLHYKAQLVKKLNPQIFCPFAGYFVEAHPSDKYIKETNLKNDAATLNQLINKISNAITWTPKPGAVLDVGRLLKDPNDCKGIVDPPEGTKIFKDSWDFETYLDPMNASFTDDIFKSSSWIKEYFTWAGFKGYNLVIRMIETDEDFVDLPGGYNYLVDFLDLSFPSRRPSRDHPYEEIRSRATVMRHVVKNGLLWDDLYIGFQNRIQRNPDVYHHQFWNHFQIKLPPTPPDWNAFLEQKQSCNVM